MHSILDKDMIEMEIVPFIPKTKRCFTPNVSISEIVSAILPKLKTGAQWNQLTLKATFQGCPSFGNRSTTITGSGASREHGYHSGRAFPERRCRNRFKGLPKIVR